MKNFMQSFAAVGASVALIATFSSRPAQAATFTQNFEVVIASGKLAGETFKGLLSYDDSLLTGTGIETISADDELTLDFNFLGKTYTEEDDFSFPLFPLVEILNGSEVTGLNYLVATNDILLSFDSGLSGNGIGKVFSYEIGSVNAIVDAGAGEVRFVPEPTTILGTLLVGSLGLAMRRKATASKEA